MINEKKKKTRGRVERVVGGEGWSFSFPSPAFLHPSFPQFKTQFLIPTSSLHPLFLHRKLNFRSNGTKNALDKKVENRLFNRKLKMNY